MGDVDEDYIHIRRAIVNRKLDEPKTAESIACLPLLDQVRVPLELWRGKRTNTAPDEWVIVDVPNMLNRVIKPHVIGNDECDRCEKIPTPSGVNGLYAGRRGACTAVVEAINGNYAVAQALLRHKKMTTTLNVYKKQITPDAFKAGMTMFQKALKAGGGSK